MRHRWAQGCLPANHSREGSELLNTPEPSALSALSGSLGLPLSATASWLPLPSREGEGSNTQVPADGSAPASPARALAKSDPPHEGRQIHLNLITTAPKVPLSAGCPWG